MSSLTTQIYNFCLDKNNIQIGWLVAWFEDPSGSHLLNYRTR